MAETISRRTFVAGTAAVAGAVAVGSSVAQAAEPVGMTPGTYEGEAPGHRGTIRVAVTVSEDAIENVEFLECVPRTNEVIPPLEVNPFAIYAMAMLADAPQIIKTVVERLPERIVASQSVDVDAVCGATISSFGFLAAVRDALAQAGAPDGAFDRPVEKVDATEEYDGFDVIVVGGGASGSTAAASATASGARVLLIEKSGRIGGCGSMSSGVHCVNSKIQLATAGIETGDEPAVLSVEADQTSENAEYFPMAMAQSLWYAKAPVMKQFLDHGGEAVDFIHELGGFEFSANPVGVGYSKDSILDPNASESWYRVAQSADTVLLETCVTALLTDEAGAVVGVEAVKWDGTKVTAHAPAVIIATGGFMGNPELQKKYNDAFFSTRFAMAQDKGECLQMEWDLGAKPWHIGGMNIHITQPCGEVKGFDDYAAMIPYTLHAAANMLRVNGRGERFSSETILAENMVGNGNYIAAQGGYFYTIVSKDQMDVLAQGGLAATGLVAPVFCVDFNFYCDPIDYPMADIEAVLDAGVEDGYIFKGETLAELAEAAGFKADLFERHVARYEAACEAGFDDLYYKDPALLFPLGSGPYYAIKSECCPYSTMGGVEVDELMRVLDAEGDPIPGLYQAGVESIGALYNGHYSDCGGFPFGWSVYSGYAAGICAAIAPTA